MAVAACPRSILRSASFRNAAVKLATEAKAARAPPPPLSKHKPHLPRFLRSPVEMSCSVESLLPLHTATSSALLTSMLAVSRGGYGRLSHERYLPCETCTGATASGSTG